MTKSIADILADKWQEPPEIQAIKDYIKKRFDEPVAVSIQSKQIVINVANSALAATLRMQLYDLQKSLKTDKKLVIRIGH